VVLVPAAQLLAAAPCWGRVADRVRKGGKLPVDPGRARRVDDAPFFGRVRPSSGRDHGGRGDRFNQHHVVEPTLLKAVLEARLQALDLIGP